MAKKVVSVGLHKKKKHIKTCTKRRHLKSVFRKLFNYMKSDTFMYAPLAFPPYLTFPPPNFDEEMKMKKGVVEDDANYLKSDCYMYAPLVESANAIGEKNGSQMEASRGEAGSYNPVQRVVLHRTILQKKTVEQVLHQKCHPSSVPGN